MELTITGTVQVKFDRVDRTSQSTGNTFSTRDLVIRTDDQYPQDICIQFTQDKCDLLDNYQIGESVKIAFNLRGQLNGWTNPQGDVKYFNTVQAWKIQRNSAAATAQGQPATPPPPSAPAAAPQRKYVHIDAAVPETAYIAAKWTYDQLVANGKGRWETATATPPPPSAPAAPAPHDDLPF